ncbi:glycosyltransferase [Bacteroides fragilis]
MILRIKELNIGERIKYCGPVFGHQKMEVLKNSDIYVLTSRSEAMPLSISEALSVGTPCLVTHGTNMSNLIEQYKAGWSSSLNKEDLAFNILKAIKEYKDSPVTFRKSARGLYEYNSSIDVGKVSIDQYKTILEEK